MVSNWPNAGGVAIGVQDDGGTDWCPRRSWGALLLHPTYPFSRLARCRGIDLPSPFAADSTLDSGCTPACRLVPSDIGH